MSSQLPREPVVRYERRIKETETLRVYDDGFLIIVKPMSAESCVIYGRNTKWCISMKQSARNWSNYSAKNVCFYIIINNNLDIKNPLNKTLAEVGDNGEIIWWDALDRIIEKPFFIE